MSVKQSLLVKHQAENAKLFRKFAPFYDLTDFVVGNIRKSVAKNISANSKVIDVACGTGSQAIFFAKLGHYVTGIDISPDMLARARKKAMGVKRITLLERDATATGFADDTFDVATISFGLHDMPEVIAAASLKELQRVVKPGGTIYILDYGQPAGHLLSRSSRMICNLWESEHYNSYIMKGVNHFLSATDLSIKYKRTYLTGIIQLTAVGVE